MENVILGDGGMGEWSLGIFVLVLAVYIGTIIVYKVDVGRREYLL